MLVEYTIEFIDALQNEDFNETETTVDRFVADMVQNTKYTRSFANGMYRMNMKFLYQDIYDLEIHLRSILSYIYINEFYPELETFHKNLKQPPRALKQ